jgi:hypothetical protein
MFPPPTPSPIKPVATNKTNHAIVIPLTTTLAETMTFPYCREESVLPCNQARSMRNVELIITGNSV